MMADPYIKEFRGRLRRVERIHRRGGGFEAAGTLGRSHYTARAPRRSSWLKPLLLVAAGALLLKALLYMQIGPVDYADRVARLSKGSQVEKIGAYIMQADGVTVFFGELLGELFKKPL